MRPDSATSTNTWWWCPPTAAVVMVRHTPAGVIVVTPHGAGRGDRVCCRRHLRELLAQPELLRVTEGHRAFARALLGEPEVTP